MAFSANFFDAYNTEKTNIRKRRKENAEMFEAYKDAKVADGEEVSVEELSNMRSNLAGGDFYFGQALPAEKMMQGLADRTNERVTNTISAEFAQQAEQTQKISKVVDNIVPSLLNIADIDGADGQEKLKARFTAINPKDPAFGNQLYESWKDRLPNMIEVAKDKEVNDFMAKHSNANLFSEVEHLTVGLPSWKVNAIRQGYLSKEKVFDNKNFTDALKSVNVNTKPAEFTRMGTTELDEFAKLYLLRSGVLEKDITPERIAATKAALQPIYNAETRAYSEKQETAFETDVEKDLALLDMISDPTLDNQRMMLDTVNRYRRDNELPEYANINDANFQKLLKSMGTPALSAAKAKYAKMKTTADATAKTIYDAAVTTSQSKFDSILKGMTDSDNKTATTGIAEQLHNSYHIPPSMVSTVLTDILTLVEDDFPSNPTEQAAIIGLMVRRHGLSTSTEAILDYQAAQRKRDAIGIKPNTTVTEYFDMEMKPFLVFIQKPVTQIALLPINKPILTSGAYPNGISVPDIQKKAIQTANDFFDNMIKQIDINEFLLDGDDDDGILVIKKKIEEARTAAIMEINNAKPNAKPTYFSKSGPNYITNNQPLPSGMQPGRYQLQNGQYVYVGPLTQQQQRTKISNGVRYVKNGRGRWIRSSNQNNIP